MNLEPVLEVTLDIIDGKAVLPGKANNWYNIEKSIYKPGEGGRPKGVKNKGTIARKWLELSEKAVNEITGIEEILSQEDMMTLAMIKRAKKGDVKAYKELMNAAFGEDKNITHSGSLGLANITGMEVH